MPLIDSTYQPKFPFLSGHFSTIYSATMRPAPKLKQERERLILSDGDFLDIDWSFSKDMTKKIAVILHGLEGNSKKGYVTGQGKILVENGWDVIAMNHKGCSGEDNLNFDSYNSGRTDDLAAIVDMLQKKEQYENISLIGFSLGGNVVLKYLGERQTLPKEIKKGVAISTPLQLLGTLESLEKPENWIYYKNFVHDLKKKYKRKMAKFPDQMGPDQYKKISSLLDFDTIYTAPAHGFKDAYDYYEKSSSLKYVQGIKIPVLILNALNDSFLSEDCYPFKIASDSSNIFLETPKYGGHVGFHLNNQCYYSEQRTLEFIS